MGRGDGGATVGPRAVRLGNAAGGGAYAWICLGLGLVGEPFE